MTLSATTRRHGLTLTESLVAMFIAAIGMISLMALFPLGALQMGQALKDARCTETATNAEAILRSYWRVEVIEKNSEPAILTAFGTNPGLSDPVFIDPIGRLSTATNIGGIPGLSRQRINTATTFLRAFRYCSLLDDMTFDPSGAPVVTGGRLERAGRYNWLAVLQREDNTVATYESKLTILVFDGRAPGFLAPNSEMVYDASAPATRLHSFIPGATTLQLRFPSTDTRPPLSKGRWVAFFTPANRLLTFHRVVSLADADNGTNITYNLELQTPIPTGTATSLGHDPATCRVIVFAGLAEVFERAPLVGQ